MNLCKLYQYTNVNHFNPTMIAAETLGDTLCWYQFDLIDDGNPNEDTFIKSFGDNVIGVFRVNAKDDCSYWTETIDGNPPTSPFDLANARIAMQELHQIRLSVLPIHHFARSDVNEHGYNPDAMSKIDQLVVATGKGDLEIGERRAFRVIEEL